MQLMTDRYGPPNVSNIPTFAAAGNPFKVANPDAAGLADRSVLSLGELQLQPESSNPTTGYNWASAINNPLNWSEWNVRADYDVTKKQPRHLPLDAGHLDQPDPQQRGFLLGRVQLSDCRSSWSQPSKSVMAKLSSTISNSMVNDVEFGYGHNAIITTLGGTRADIVQSLRRAYPSTFPVRIKKQDEFFGGWGGLNPYGSYQGEASFWNIAPYKNHEDLYTVQDNLSKVQGNHLLKAGAFCRTNEKVENNGNGADRRVFPTRCLLRHGCGDRGDHHRPQLATRLASTPAML